MAVIQWDYTKAHGPTCTFTLVGGTCNCPHGRHLRELGAAGAWPEPRSELYRVVKASGEVAGLDFECSRLMLLGWTPHGNLVIAAHFDQRGVFVIEFYQPMVRLESTAVFVTHPEGCTCGKCGGGRFSVLEVPK